MVVFYNVRICSCASNVKCALMGIIYIVNRITVTLNPFHVLN